MNLTAEQQNAVTLAVDAIKNGSLFRIGGYAGTGKTTIAKFIVESVPKAMVCAFTGKAANRLAEKGLPMAQTLHRTIYNYDPYSKTFSLKDQSEVYGDYFLIDEGSMISMPLWRDVQSFGKPIIVLGDPGQLEPIGDDPNLMENPDVVLEQIEQANDIIETYRADGYLRFQTELSYLLNSFGRQRCSIESPARFQHSQFPIKRSHCIHSFIRLLFVAANPTREPRFEFTELQSYDGFILFDYKIRQKFPQKRFCFSRGYHPTKSGVRPRIRYSVVLNRTATSNFAAHLQSFNISHCDLNVEPKGICSQIAPSRSVLPIDDNTSFAVDKTAQPCPLFFMTHINLLKRKVHTFNDNTIERASQQ